MGIPFTQHLIPDGTPIAVTFEHADEIEALAQSVIAAGGSFQTRVLSNKRVLFECVRPVGDTVESVAVEISDNGPETFEAVRRLVKAAHAVFGTP